MSFFDPNFSLFGYEIVRASPLVLILVDDRYVPLVAPELFFALFAILSLMEERRRRLYLEDDMARLPPT